MSDILDNFVEDSIDLADNSFGVLEVNVHVDDTIAIDSETDFIRPLIEFTRPNLDNRPIRLYFDLEVIESMDSHAMRIYETESVEGEGVLIDVVRIKAGIDFVEVTNYSDTFNWFRLEVLDPFGESLGISDRSILAECTENKILTIREAMRDTNPEDPAFSDDDLLIKMRMGARRLGSGYRNLSDVPENMWGLIIILVRIDLCYVLAFDFAKYQRLEIPGGASLHRDQLYKHYLDIAKQLEDYYRRFMGDINSEMDLSAHTVEVSDMERDSYETGFTESNLQTGGGLEQSWRMRRL